jgi:hypothetical protein
MATVAKSNFRPWYKLHVTTLLGVVAVGAAIVYANCQWRIDSGSGGIWSWTQQYHRGWPTICRGLTVVEWTDGEISSPQFARNRIRTEYQWYTSGLALNITAFLVATGATALAGERWGRRNNRRWQFSFRSLLIVVTAVGFLLFFYRNEFFIYWWLARVLNNDSYVLYIFGGGLRFRPWYLAAPIAFGIGCVLFLSCSLFLDAMSAIARKVVWLRFRRIERAG